MPSHLLGADVPCFVAAVDHLTAVRLAADTLASQGLVFEDVIGSKVTQLDPSQWDQHASRFWDQLPGDLSEQREAVRKLFPDQRGILELLRVGGVVFGPFCGWEREA